jgi:peptidoglycan/LPS O-acetylase OafA/YrhL
MAKYQASIDGLRALCVLSVLLFHLDHVALPGGFVGVDVFFTISGYLIGQILLRQVEEGQFGFAAFYQRRIARLLPAFAVVSLGTLAAACAIYSHQDVASVASKLVSASLGIANFKEMQTGNYFTASPDAQPLLHLWSLAVEEQFYFLFPVLLVGLRPLTHRARTLVLGTLALASLVACVYLTQARPSWAFYLLPTRAWELLAGALLACFRSNGAARSVPGPPWLGWLGLGSICASFVVVEAGDGFPGFQASLPVFGAVLLIHAVSNHEGHAVARLLSGSSITAIGRASYVLYMVHWPVFCLVDYYAFRAPSAERIAVKLLTAAVLTILVHRAIELPARGYLRRRERRAIAYGALAITVLGGVTLGTYVRETRFIHARSGVRGAPVLNSSARGGDVVLLGDSFGAVYGTAIRDMAVERDLRVHAYTYPGDLPLPLPGGGGLWSEVFPKLQAIKPTTIVLAISWMTKLGDDPTRLLRGVERLELITPRIIALTQPPHRPASATRDAIRRGARGPAREDPTTRDARRRADDNVRALRARGVEVVDVEALLTNPDGSIRVFDAEGRENYHDVHHLSAHGSRLVAQAVAKLIDQPPLQRRARRVPAQTSIRP